MASLPACYTYGNYECYVVTVFKVTDSAVYYTVPFRADPKHYEPFGENGISVFHRDEWTEVIKIAFRIPVTPAMRGKILRYIRDTNYPTAKYIGEIGNE